MRVIISAGGTGGHIYPALAIINKIKEKEKDSTFLYIGTHDRMEKDIIPKENIPFKSIEVYGFNGNIKTSFKALKYFFKNIKELKQVIKEFNPDIVIGVGGYVTAPVIYTAKKLGYKTVIHEQNRIPGKANRFLARFTDLIMLSFKSSSKYFKNNDTIFTGNPCSSQARNIKACDKLEFGLNENKKLVLIVMGSLGAKRVNEVIVNTLDKFKNKDYEVVFITGKKNFEEVNKVKFPSNVKVLPYVENLSRLMKRVDVIISRAGASTLSEIIALKIPSILIPSPYVPNNHQFINAMDLVNNKAALLIEEKALNSDTLIDNIDKIINDEKAKNIMRKNLIKLDVLDSGELIYKNIKKLIDRK